MTFFWLSSRPAITSVVMLFAMGLAMVALFGDEPGHEPAASGSK
ncbi:MAG: hypothetical protein AAFU79_16755 [Myxococcota bacterium]